MTQLNQCCYQVTHTDVRKRSPDGKPKEDMAGDVGKLKEGQPRLINEPWHLAMVIFIKSFD